MKEELIKMIKILGVGFNELIIDFNLGANTFNSIELNPKSSKIYLHIFEEDFDLVFDFDELNEEDQKEIFEMLSKMLYN